MVLDGEEMNIYVVSNFMSNVVVVAEDKRMAKLRVMSRLGELSETSLWDSRNDNVTVVKIGKCSRAYEYPTIILANLVSSDLKGL